MSNSVEEALPNQWKLIKGRKKQCVGNVITEISSSEEDLPKTPATRVRFQPKRYIQELISRKFN